MKIITNYYTYSVRQTARRLGPFLSRRSLLFRRGPTFHGANLPFGAALLFHGAHLPFGSPLFFRGAPFREERTLLFRRLFFFGTGLFRRVFLLRRGPFFAAAFSFCTGLFSPSLSPSDMPERTIQKNAIGCRTDPCGTLSRFS